jgi:dihydroorotase
MKLIIRAAKIIDSKSPYHNQVVDVQINDAIIEKIGVNLPNLEHYEEVQRENLHLSEGWFDLENLVLKIEKP